MISNLEFTGRYKIDTLFTLYSVNSQLRIVFRNDPLYAEL